MWDCCSCCGTTVQSEKNSAWYFADNVSQRCERYVTYDAFSLLIIAALQSSNHSYRRDATPLWSTFDVCLSVCRFITPTTCVITLRQQTSLWFSFTRLHLYCTLDTTTYSKTDYPNTRIDTDTASTAPAYYPGSHPTGIVYLAYWSAPSLSNAYDNMGNWQLMPPTVYASCHRLPDYIVLDYTRLRRARLCRDIAAGSQGRGFAAWPAASRGIARPRRGLRLRRVACKAAVSPRAALSRATPSRAHTRVRTYHD